MEEVLAGHAAVAECAVVGCNDELKGQVPIGFVVLKHANDGNEAAIEQELMQRIRDTIGALASLKKVYFLERLPKTRSGKILRKIIRCIVDDVAFQPPSTIEDITMLEEIRWTVGRGGN